MQRGGRKVSFGSSARYRPDYQAPKKQRHISRYLKPALAIVCLLVVLYGILFSPLFRVRTIAVSGNEQLTTREVQSQVKDLLGRSFLGDNAIFVNPIGLARELKKRNYQLEQVSVERSLLGGIRVRLKEQRATIQWRSGSSVFVLSGNGVAYAELSSVNTALPIVEDSTNLPVKSGEKIVPSSFVKFIAELPEQLAAAKLKAISISVADTTTEIEVKTDKGFMIKLDTTRSLDSQMADYRSVAAKQIVPKEYVDLRIPGKVFYK